MIVLGKERYIFFVFWVSQVRSGLCLSITSGAPLPCCSTSWATCKCLYICKGPVSLPHSLLCKMRVQGDVKGMVVITYHGGPVTQPTQNGSCASLYEGTLLGSRRLMWLQVYPSVNLILYSSVQCRLCALQICSFRRWGEKIHAYW